MSSELGVERPTTLPLPEPQEERRVHFGAVSSRYLIGDGKRQTTTSCSRFPEFRPKRLRSASFSAPGEIRHGNKRRRRYRVLPSKFLLGGNITDPLNLGSLEDREDASQLGLVEAAAAGTVTKKSAAVKVIIPPNINDPLNLDVSSDNEETLNDALQKQFRRRRRSKRRKRRLSEPSGDATDCEPLQSEKLDDCQLLIKAAQSVVAIPEILPKILPDTLKPLTVNTELPTSTTTVTDDQREVAAPTTPVGTKPSTSGFQRPAFKKQRSKSDKIVSPVVPQPGVERKRHPSHSRQHAEKPHLSQQNLKLPNKFNPKNEHFQYGNYNKYYGYRNPDMSQDIRLQFMKPEWFEGKDVLDVGCNIGHITLTIARDLNPRKVVGIDIDKKLINIAQKNIKHYRKKGDIQETNFPKSMRLLYGPLKPPMSADGVHVFPHNIKFIHANYVLESDELLETVRPEFDVIMCLSITKWIHLNWGDAGLKRFFRRVFYNLKPGGRLILEPQGWPSYNKRRKLTLQIFENYKNIRLFPDKFNDYLLHEVGFSTSEKMITPHHSSRGFRRPIIVYTKASSSSKSSLIGDNRMRSKRTKHVRISQEFLPEDGNVPAEPEKMEIAQSTSKEENGKSENPVSNKSGELDKDNAQSKVLTDGSAICKVSGEQVEAMDCSSNSQCGNDVKRVSKGQESAGKEGGESVCDINAKKSLVYGVNNSHLTHSPGHKPNLCVSESHSSSLGENSSSTELRTKAEVLKPDTSSGMELVVEGQKNHNSDASQADNCSFVSSSQAIADSEPKGEEQKTACKNVGEEQTVGHEVTGGEEKTVCQISAHTTHTETD